MKNDNAAKRRGAHDLDERGRQKYERGLALCGIIIGAFTVIHFFITALMYRQIVPSDVATIVLMAAVLPVVRGLNGICEPPKCLGTVLDPERITLPKRLLRYAADALIWGAVIAAALLYFNVVRVRGVPVVFAAVTALRFIMNLLCKEGSVRKYSREQKKQETEENDLS